MYLRYHLWIASQFPETVAALEHFNDKLPFEPVMLGGAITATDGTPTNHGLLTAVISYHTSYRFSDGMEFLLQFALGSKVAVNLLFGWADIRRLQTTFDTTNALTSRALQASFDVIMREPDFDLPFGTIFDPTHITLPHLTVTPSETATTTIANIITQVPDTTTGQPGLHQL